MPSKPRSITARDVTAFLIAPEVIDKDNYQAVLFDSGYYSEDQLK